MIKLAHLSDVHLGFGRSSWRFVRGDVFRSFRQAFREANSWADVILVTGDLFHSVRNDVEAIRLAARELRSADCPVIVIGGNHDTPATSGVDSPLSMLAEMCTNIMLAELSYRAFKVAGLEIHCVPARYLAYWTDPIYPHADAVLAIHGVHPYSPMKPPGESWLIPQLYDPRRFLYIALGDLHDWHSVPTLYPPREFYAGSTGYCSSNVWSETRAKGWLKVELGRLLEVKFVPVEQRAWITVEADLDEDQGLDYIARELKRLYSELRATGRVTDEPPVLRVVLTGRDRQQLVCMENTLRQSRLPVSALHVVRRVRAESHKTEVSAGDLAKRWTEYVHQHLHDLPSALSPDEVVRRGLEALDAVHS